MDLFHESLVGSASLEAPPCPCWRCCLRTWRGNRKPQRREEVAPASLSMMFNMCHLIHTSLLVCRMSLTTHAGNLTLTTVLWFDTQAEEAAKFYTSVFPNSKILRSQRYSKAGQEVHGQEPGSILFVEFDLDGHRFSGLNGGPHVTFNHAVSLMIDCADQKEVDYYWGKLSEGGDVTKQECGWLADKFGVSWQVVPKRLKEMLVSEDVAAAGRASVAMMGMKKLDIEGLEKAFKGE
ncbi:uncharacterized protein QC764_701020 [Podospora pseudoanserina]|uniref:PhnB-like domain-containing protein n=1 Tax=Podospora pseudoanserina TaxID=2609844 RepID=A0ABR0HME8_9PEZI|nr:hypothetical protein QC764_701020 [Podospora pseudoanserina]